MNLITVEGLTHSYTDRMLFKEASFSLNEHEKVGIIFASPICPSSRNLSRERLC